MGHHSLAGYPGANPNIGSIVGPYANRIVGGSFTLKMEIYSLSRNNGPNHLRGGEKDSAM